MDEALTPENFDEAEFGQVIEDRANHLPCSTHQLEACQDCLEAARKMFDLKQPGLWTTKMKDYDGRTLLGEVTHDVVDIIWP